MRNICKNEAICWTFLKAIYIEELLINWAVTFGTLVYGAEEARQAEDCIFKIYNSTQMVGWEQKNHLDL